MKPSWDDAPEWANWLAMDADECWFWHAFEPKEHADGYWDSHGDVTQAIQRQDADWKETLEPRP